MDPEDSLQLKKKPRFSAGDTHDGEKVISLPYKSPVWKERIKKISDDVLIRLDKHLIKGVAAFILIAAVGGGFFLKQSSLLKDAYRNGFNDGMSSLQSNLRSAQQITKDQGEQITRLQSNLGSSNDNLIGLQQELNLKRRTVDTLSKENNRLTDHLKVIKEAHARKISDLKGYYERKLDRVVKQSKARVSQLMSRPQQHKIEQLTADLAATQSRLESVNKELQGKTQLNVKLQNDLREFRSYSGLMQGQVNELKRELDKEARAKADALAQLKAAKVQAEAHEWSGSSVKANSQANARSETSLKDAQTPYWLPEEYNITGNK